MKDKLILIFAVLSLFAAASCKREIVAVSEDLGVGVIATVPDFEEFTKTSVSPAGVFSWAEGDVIGVVPMDGSTYQTNYEVKAIGENPRTASFDGGSWKLQEGKEYAAYYPCQDVELTSDETLSLQIEGQKQMSNGNTGHLGAVDIMYAGAVGSVDGNATFSFKHKVSLVKFVLPIHQAGTYVELSLKADKPCFGKNAVLSVSDGAMSVSTHTSALNLALNDIALSVGETLEAYMFAFPASLSGCELTMVLTASDGNTLTYEVIPAFDSFMEGKAYLINCKKSSKEIFKDDFSWVAQFVTDDTTADFVNGTQTRYPTLKERIDDGNNNSPNLYSTFGDTFKSAFSKAGYADAIPENKTIYAQGTKANPYLKFCKGNTQTALILQPFRQSYAGATISMDWAIHMTTSALDVVDFQLRIEGAGTFANGGKQTDIFTCSQTSVADPVWSKAVASLSNVDASTKIYISSRTAFEEGYLASGQHRFYLDNILVTTDSGYDVDPVQPATGSTVYGIVKCGDAGIPDVVVSDGYETVKTGADGTYQLKSAKKNGYVFISIPSGYEVASDGVLPVFHSKLMKSATMPERVDFELYDAGDQTNHTVLYLGDMHMANRNKDRDQFRKFTTEIAQYVNDHPSDKIYAITLGDATWDLYWYSKNYCFEQYLNEYKGVVNNLQIFHTIGNHDHDMNATGDFDTVLRFRDVVCPNYYSFNIGKIHYVVLDNIECTNKTASKTDGKVREYNEKVVPEVMNWLKKDLSYIPKTTPIVVTMHATLYNRNGGSSLKNASELESALSGYNVTIVTGHTHRCYTIDKSSIREYNSGAVCAAWWWAGKYNLSYNYNISTDGSPSGYRVTSVQGTKQTSYFKAVGRPASYQFRAYDRNKINLDADMAPEDAKSAFRAELLLSAFNGNYSGPSSDNIVIIHVWDWNSKWKVEVTENGSPLTVKQEDLMDPSFYLAYTLPHFKAGNTTVSWHPYATNNMFTVKAKSATSTLTIKVTDDEGRVYTSEMKRPMEFTIENCAK